MAKLLDTLKRLFGRGQKDPLDELLIEKGLDPDQVMEDAHDERRERGSEDPVNRMHERIERKAERAEKQRKMNRWIG